MPGTESLPELTAECRCRRGVASCVGKQGVPWEFLHGAFGVVRLWGRGEMLAEI